MKVSSVILICYILVFKLYGVNGSNLCLEEQRLDQLEKWKAIFPQGYRQNTVPKLKNEWTVLWLGVYPRGIPEISFQTMSLHIDIYVSLTWSDCRLSLPELNHTTAIPDEISEELWHPKIYFGNGLGAKPLRFTGDISPMYANTKHQLNYGKREIIPFYCEFDLSSYPMDVQRCELHIQPIGDLMMKELTDPEKEISLKGRTPPHLTIESIMRGKCTEKASKSTGGSCLALILNMKRSVSYYLTVIYFPSMLIVSLTWLSFWLDVDASAPRVVLGLTSLLTLATQFANVQKNLPPVSYVKAVDVWMFACMVLVFASLVEFAIANYSHRRSNNQKATFLKILPKKNNVFQNGKIHAHIKENIKANSSVKVNFIDRISRKIFPIIFLFFNVAYWSFYLYLKDSFFKTL